MMAPRFNIEVQEAQLAKFLLFPEHFLWIESLW